MTKEGKYHILCILDDDYGRDVELLLPLIYYAEKYLNCFVEYAFIWDIHSIYRKKPDLLLLANTIGSLLHFKASRYANQNNIKVFALVSEGNFRTDGSFDYWGYNRDKNFYQEFICLWSERTCKYLKEELPSFAEKMVLTGATGFDRYTIYQFKKRGKYLEDRGIKSYRKVIGYAGWAFGKMYNKQGFEELKFLHQYDEKKIKWIEDQMYLVESILRSAIEKNPDTLFILKRHPNEANPTILGEGKNEMVRLKDYPNVLYVTENENIHDLINISDLWLAFESTTTMEAWLLGGKQTILINPDPDFSRDQLFKGSVIVENADEMQQVIVEYYNTKRIEAFYDPEKQQARIQLIKDTIGFGDGLNHVRAGYYLGKVLPDIDKSGTKKIRFSFNHFIKYMLLEIGKYFYFRPLFRILPKFKKTIWIFERFRLKNIQILKNKYYPYLDQFHEQRNISTKINSEEFWNTIIS